VHIRRILLVSKFRSIKIASNVTIYTHREVELNVRDFWYRYLNLEIVSLKSLFHFERPGAHISSTKLITVFMYLVQFMLFLCHFLNIFTPMNR